MLLIAACKKEELVFDDNTPPSYSGVSTVVLNNYINRLFIDVIGREPLNVEMEAEVAALREADLGMEARSALVDKLMYSTDFVEGDSSYRRAYCVKLYENLKARFIEGASDEFLLSEYNMLRGNAVLDSLNGDMTGYTLKMQDAQRLSDLLESRAEWQENEISIDTMVQRMLLNAIYDEINMNAFNFVNASFDDLFYRFPTPPEFESAYTIVEFNQPATLFNAVAQNKAEYVALITATGEYYEGMVIWVYQSLLSRPPTSSEVFSTALDFRNTQDISAVQRKLLVSDEYAGFN